MDVKPTKLAGSPWANLTPPRRRGRPRKFANDDPAERKRASRAAKKLKESAGAAEKERLAQITALREEQAKDDNGRGGSLLLSDADRGTGRIVTGGYNTRQIDNVDSARLRDGVTDEDFAIGSSGSGRKVSAQGCGRDEEGDDDKDAAPTGGWEKPRGDNPSEKTNKKVGFLVCPLHSVVGGECRTFRVGVQEQSNGRGKPKTHTFWVTPGPDAAWDARRGMWLLPLHAERKKGAWHLFCGCVRPIPKKIIVTPPPEPIEEIEAAEVDESAALASTLRRKWLSDVL